MIFFAPGMRFGRFTGIAAVSARVACPLGRNAVFETLDDSRVRGVPDDLPGVVQLTGFCEALHYSNATASGSPNTRADPVASAS